MTAVFQIVSLFDETLCLLKICCNSLVEIKKVEELVWSGIISFYSFMYGTNTQIIM